MIGENIPEQHERARAELAERVERFLARGGQIQDCAGAVSAPRRPCFRWYPPPQTQPLEAGVQIEPQPKSNDAASTHRPSKQKAERQLKRQAKMLERAELVDKIRAYSYTSLSRDAVAKTLGISHQQLSKLIIQHGIHFPKWRQPK